MSTPFFSIPWYWVIGNDLLGCVQKFLYQPMKEWLGDSIYGCLMGKIDSPLHDSWDHRIIVPLQSLPKCSFPHVGYLSAHDGMITALKFESEFLRLWRVQASFAIQSLFFPICSTRFPGPGETLCRCDSTNLTFYKTDESVFPYHTEFSLYLTSSS